MADDLRPIFDRAALDMRPQFEARMRTLLTEQQPELWLVPEPDGDTVTVDIDETDEPAPRSLARRMWPILLVAAAAIVLFLLVGRQTAPPPAPATLPPPPDCSAPAKTIGTVPTAGVDIRVGLMPDGSSFCLADDATGTPIGPISLVTGPQPSTPLDQPAITFQSTIGDIAKVWVITVPDEMPAEYVSSPDLNVVSFPSRVGRRLLVVHPIGQGPEPTDQSVLQVFSGRDLLATLAVPSEDPS
jgi:hypothetical protein